VHIGSSPQLNFQNAYAKLAGNVDLRLRGTAAQPSLLGRISITEGSGIIAGTRYELQRGDINFTNPVRIEPTIDLNATARVEDYDISLGVHGTPQKLSASYRSDPPLPEADVVALLALGRTESQQRLYTQQQQQALSNPTTDALLGGALNATVSSRVQKLFGTGNVKVDPNYLGSLGNSTSRIIVEEQFAHPDLRHQRQHHRPATASGRYCDQPPRLPAVGARRVRRLLRGSESHPPLSVGRQGTEIRKTLHAQPVTFFRNPCLWE
jgi:translocation and assembly module TamB